MAEQGVRLTYRTGGDPTGHTTGVRRSDTSRTLDVALGDGERETDAGLAAFAGEGEDDRFSIFGFSSASPGARGGDGADRSASGSAGACGTNGGGGGACAIPCGCIPGGGGIPSGGGTGGSGPMCTC